MKTAKKTTKTKHAPSSNSTTSKKEKTTTKKPIKEIDNENQCTSVKTASDIHTSIPLFAVSISYCNALI